MPRPANPQPSSPLVIAVLAAIFVLAAAGVLAASWTSPIGLLNIDSTLYLRLAAFLEEGRGFGAGVFKSAIDRGDTPFPYFAVWPVGYPVLIAAVSALTPADVFWASKLVNIAAIAAGLLMLHRVFGRHAVAPAALYLFATVWSMHAWSLAEAPFLPVQFLFFALLAALDDSDRPWRLAAAAAAAALALFLLRYIGAYAFLIGGLAVLRATWWGRRRIAAALTVCFAVAGGLALLYLWHNQVQTGLWTGTLRVPNRVPPEDLALAMARSVWVVVNPVMQTAGPESLRGVLLTLLFVGVPVLAVVVAGRRDRREWPVLDPFVDRFTGWAAVSGLVYLAALYGLRARQYFEAFDLRFLATGLVPIALWLFWRVLRRQGRAARVLTGAALGLGILSWLHNVALPTADFVRAGGTPYPVVRAALAERFAALPEGSVYIFGFGRPEVFFLRPDVAVTHPRVRFRGGQSWEEFLATLRPFGRPVYAYDDWEPAPRFDDSVVAAYRERVDGRGLVRLD
ncbi:hypothetical protein [Azospirillum halopraeferens]|uniref:hypothetical protein n=1 Tax=Azospirillum halopraeferens TaxID=34010 RepID=UPI0004220742|nr:hypothetical protein [Azospirillum halopraeferens]